jgi:hypothetical protein
MFIVKTMGIQNKERILKAAREKHHVTCKGKPIRITADFSTETLKARSAWNDVFQFPKENTGKLDYCIQQSSPPQLKEK